MKALTGTNGFIGPGKGGPEKNDVRCARRAQAGGISRLSRDSSGADFLESPSPSSSPMPKMSLHVGVLHYTPFRRAPSPLSPASCCQVCNCMHASAYVRHHFVEQGTCQTPTTFIRYSFHWPSTAVP